MSLQGVSYNELAKSYFQKSFRDTENPYEKVLLDTQDLQNEVHSDQDYFVCSRHACRACEVVTGCVCDSEPCAICYGFPVYLVDLSVQSADMVKGGCCDADGDRRQEIVHFSDNVAGDMMALPHSISYANMDTTHNSEMSKFLNRPVEIATYSWTEGTVFQQSFEPWKLFFDHTSIKKKLDNYYLLRCNLHVKVQINASPFYYGQAICAYEPLNQFDPCQFFSGSGLEHHQFMALSQRPHVYLYPQLSQGGEMVLPFFYHKQWLDATSASDLEGMGRLDIVSLSALKNANSVAGTTCNIQVYAWAENVELAAPTTRLAVQSGDEYAEKEGPVSAPASAVAKAADTVGDALTSLAPYTAGASLILKPFATATSLAATAVSGIAKLFGYTNVPVIAPVHAMKGQPFPHFASPAIGTPVEKLTYDPKNELSIDPKISGVDSEDELALSKIVSRDCFIDSFTWAASDASDTLLWNCGVTPELLRRTAISGQEYITGTPGWFVCRAFDYWRGDMLLHLKVICSQYHRGRLRVSWDPRASIGSVAQSTTEVFTEIIDITEKTDIVLRIPYTQITPYLQTIQPTLSAYYGTATEPNQFGNFNGTVSVRVLTEQTSPVSSADIEVYAYVSWAENFSVAGPTEIGTNITPYIVQSGDVEMKVSQTAVTMGGKEGDNPDFLNLVHMGEVIYSLRTLMRRTALNRVNWYIDNTNNVTVNESTFRRLPLFPGYDTNGINTADPTLGAGSKPYNYVKWTPLSWFSLPFIGVRGSVIWHVNVSANDRSSLVQLSRTSDFATVANYIETTDYNGTGTNSRLAYEYILTGGGNDLNPGATVTNQETQAGVSALCPMYSRYKFVRNNPSDRTLGASDDDSNQDCVNMTSVFYNTTTGTHKSIQFYCSAGTDYSPLFFLNVPGMYRLGATPSTP